MRWTKISAHAAVVTGILTAFLLMGELNSLPLVVGAVGIVLLTGWARVSTGHHSWVQVGLGILVSAASVGAAFGLMTLFGVFPLA